YHRDIKPQNVMEMSGRMVLIDYGIAKDLHAATQTKSADGVMGTPEYMCPDYSLSAGQTINWAQVDQYSFGVMLYELFTGTLPFDVPDGPGRSMAIYDQHLHKAPEPLRARQPGIPEAGERLVLRMLEKTPDKRFPSMAAVAQELRALAPRKSTPEKPMTVPKTTNHFVQIGGLETQLDEKTGKRIPVLRF
ncbi:MAG: protein kinase, partial [Cyanobacteria bacterium REEB65]|nr:protein kinase [Cyanobacteria bacterium REEB65]